jgi:hypothetical protein
LDGEVVNDVELEDVDDAELEVVVKAELTLQLSSLRNIVKE